MSRSYRKAIIKDRPKNGKDRDKIRRRIRRCLRQQDWLNEDAPKKDPKTIVNDYDYSDYRFDLEYHESEYRKKYQRK